MTHSLENRILRRIRGKALGWVFTTAHFRDLGPDVGIRKALQLICDRGRIRRLARGLYDNPKTHPELGMLSPSPEQIVEAISFKSHSRFQPTGAFAANLLGLSSQVPGRIVFLTDGPGKRFQIGNRLIELKHRSPSSMAGAGKITGLFIQALKHIRQLRFTDSHREILKRVLSEEQLRRLGKDIHMAPAWIADVIRSLSANTH